MLGPPLSKRCVILSGVLASAAAHERHLEGVFWLLLLDSEAFPVPVDLVSILRILIIPTVAGFFRVSDARSSTIQRSTAMSRDLSTI
jgi:hypothetical protein